ncbi:MAG: dihydropteroate synthase [Sulfuricurvum sp. MLSB]|uniref:dihydropteroate synthase n=1 Tax=unclassified Sulfuricurvum TaxID=2632390 RepID=UPI0005041840|nr:MULTISPECIES: dihydropteroate synthase [unclassified Sulfuricurvum]KFN38849.1 MAG: dihydropteroate synthase [Sulfuricurvum sp. MLSB]
MHVEKLSNTTDLHRELHKLGVDTGGIAIMADKGTAHAIKIADLHVGAANILKQDALSVGADLAVPRGTVTASVPRVDALLIANERQLKMLIQKEKAQPFGLKQLSNELESFLRLGVKKSVSVMGIVNANDDSFHKDSRFQGEAALRRIQQMIEDGADMIDLGGVSSRPGSDSVSAEEELARLSAIIDLLYEEKIYEKVRLSLDSYEPKVIAYALEKGFAIVNDITGLANDEVARLCGEYNATAVIMHMLGDPKTMQENPSYGSVVHDVELFFRDRIEKAERFGITDILLDCGIGFGKRLEDNLALITHQKHFLRLGKPLLVGASRKSLINGLYPCPIGERLPGTLAVHLKAIEEGASVVRVHDVKEHVQAIRVWEALQG